MPRISLLDLMQALAQQTGALIEAEGAALENGEAPKATDRELLIQCLKNQQAILFQCMGAMQAAQAAQQRRVLTPIIVPPGSGRG